MSVDHLSHCEDPLAQKESAHIANDEGRQQSSDANLNLVSPAHDAHQSAPSAFVPEVFADGQTKTCKTGETCAAVSNADFLDAVFHAQVEAARSRVVSFAGHPATVPPQSWGARPASDELVGTHNNYFTLSSFYDDEAGHFRRTKKAFAGLHAIMLDDLGSKVDRARVTLALSWLIETSPGNFQGGLILDEPLRDAEAADRLMKAIIVAGLCDPGAGGPTARLARLPVGINGKLDPVFSCRLIEWAPERRYSVKTILGCLGVAPMPLDRLPARNKVVGSHAPHSSPDEVFVAVPNDNPVLVELRAQGLYKKALGNGKHDVTCPWCSEHTAEVDGGTAYFEPGDGFPVGGFRCLHSHGDRLHIHELLAYLGIDPIFARMKPILRVQAGALDLVVDRAEHLLAQTGRHYQSAGLIVTVQTNPANGETAVVPVTQRALLRALARVADWQRYDARSDAWKFIDPPEKHNAVLFDMTDYPHLPVLRGLARQPYLRNDGAIVTAAGYDPATGFFGAFEARQYNIPDHPTRDDALSALAVLEDALTEVAFDADIDRAAALSAMLTASVRASLPTAPAFLVAAHAIGSGKSFLARIISAMATPQNVPGIAFPGDADEMRKTLIALLIKSPAVINFDDLNGDILPSEALKTTLTEEFIGGRLLGVSKDVTASTRTLMLFSGNNVAPVRDMARRVLTIRLDPRCENPVARAFKRPHLDAELRDDRPKYVAAALTISRAWFQAGCPMSPVKPLASYQRWSEWCRQPLLWLGQPDPASRLFEQLAHDPDAELLGRVLIGWQEAHGNTPMLLRDVVRHAECSGHPDFLEALRDVAEERGLINRRRLGWWLKRNVGRIIAGRKFERCGRARGAESWRVVQVSQVSQVSQEPLQKTVSVTDQAASTVTAIGGQPEGAARWSNPAMMETF
ncbi:MAG TPA: hypothetical protein VJ673_06555 [Aromatoleum sp.]|uniref:hypothetical protein n=1 Tax=Aromatoleum sp. TaxID=2307007 RepID=UPI002B4634C3|nr:hypothetical protein [Aromatoleum sp.]HJV25327.1 hypothetical protein [Aromatoleum sp.]